MTPLPPVPTLQRFRYASDASGPQPVCSADATSRLKRVRFEDFPVEHGTLALWVKTTSGDPNAVLLSYTPPASSHVGPLRIANPANVEVFFGDASAGPSGVALGDDTWHQLAVTYRRVPPGSYAVAVHLDGVAVYRSRGVRAETVAPGGDLFLGWDGGVGTGVVAWLSDLQVWGRALDDFQIATNYLRRAADGADGLLLHWPLDAAPPANPDAVIVPSDLRFRAGALTCGWTASEGATGYELELGRTDATWSESLTLGAVTSAVLPRCPTAAPLYARVRALAGATRTDWSPQTEIRAFELGQTAVTLDWDPAARFLMEMSSRECDGWYRAVTPSVT